MWVLLAKRNLDPDGTYSSLARMFEESEKTYSLFDEEAELEEDEEEDVDDFYDQDEESNEASSESGDESNV